ncbi:DUF2264 domain-containing protein [Kitasatospora purpeofusca]|uniref:DUF2264 domain-containing protein n=1 Tax=Kitasatospora purpeofusca TaxID=67352 RepID=UPI00224DE5AB|nr:DUF2264 domain-containing protein [Kitasatospora purpeofusca]MCX4755540.1 DUF2264 domain-containing protein [Kitasatospora purpeofusca]WSR36591.1 DUF2264 domain-containing protein [Kitasatospora purpeofusca]WSR44873.1 DUF2264 domain-containing protein [Kitasatospora purpeofusca]
MPLPPEDRHLSPRTGWTRAHWEAVADGLLTAVRPFASPGHALIDLPGTGPSWSGRRSDGLEGYARTFLPAALRIAGADGDDPHGLLDAYARGLDTGTRTPTAERGLTDDDPESWPLITDRGQAMVEAASIAFALRLTRPWLWDRLDAPVRDRVGRWLADALHRTPNDNNWWIFPLSVGGFLAEAGIEEHAADAAVRRGLERIERFHLGDGWYTDGRPRAFDHYNGWALHLYPVLHAHLAADRPLLAEYGSRLAAHLADQSHLFGGDGAPVHQGRSLTYRFAATAPLWAGALTGHTPLAPGTTRRIASGALRHFVDRGAIDERGLLTLGWYGPEPRLVQPYSGPASPYWAGSGFLGLLLPPDHPVWTEPEQPAPAEERDTVRILARPNWLVQSTAADGLVRLHNHGSDDQPADDVRPDDPHYARLAHSTATGPTHDGPADNHLALLIDGAASERGRIEPVGCGPDWAASLSRPRVRGEELAGVTVTTVTLVHGADEARVHLVTGAAPGTGVRQTGWAVAGRTAGTGAGAAAAVQPGARASADGGRLVSELTGLHGFTGAALLAVPGGTAFGPEAAVPVLDAVLGNGSPDGGSPDDGASDDGAALFACAARLTGTALLPPLAATLEVTGAAADGTRHLRLTWPDGTTHRIRIASGTVAVGEGS